MNELSRVLEYLRNSENVRALINLEEEIKEIVVFPVSTTNRGGIERYLIEFVPRSGDYTIDYGPENDMIYFKYREPEYDFVLAPGSKMLN